MLPYFKKYTFAVCAIAIALPVIVSTIYPLVTGQIMAASIGGLIGLFVLLFVGLFIGFGIFERKAEAVADGYIAAYNDHCDPETFIEEGAALAQNITMPCNQNGAWFLGYYAQALLDVGEVARAKEIEEGLLQSFRAAKNPLVAVHILIQVLPLEEKLGDPEQVRSLIAEGLKLTEEDPKGALTPARDFLLSQQKLFDARTGGDESVRAHLDEQICTSDAYPMRIRVEAAWDGAAAYFRLGDQEQEKKLLSFAAEKGNKLALATKARARLEKLS